MAQRWRHQQAGMLPPPMLQMMQQARRLVFQPATCLGQLQRVRPLRQGQCPCLHRQQQRQLQAAQWCLTVVRLRTARSLEARPGPLPVHSPASICCSCWQTPTRQMAVLHHILLNAGRLGHLSNGSNLAQHTPCRLVTSAVWQGNVSCRGRSPGISGLRLSDSTHLLVCPCGVLERLIFL